MFITISRQYAAGGSEVARLVAEALGWTVVDDDFVTRLSERSGFTQDDVAGLEERVPTFFERMAQSTALSFPEYLSSSPELLEQPDAVKLAKISRELVAELGRNDRMVFVGRASAAVLARATDVLHVRLVASEGYRIRHAIEHLGVPEADAAKVLDTTDRNRERYHRELYGRDWNDPVLYHLVLNTELLGTDGAAGLIVARARALDW
jgi:cytidylate kinase